MSLQVSTHKKAAVLETANALLKAQNRVTTLEIKTSLRNNPKWDGYYWDQNIVSTLMIELQKEGKFDFVDTGVYRIYTGKPGKAKFTHAPVNTIATPATKRPVGRPRKTPVVATSPAKKPVAKSAKPVISKTAVRISRKKALEMMQNNKGRFFTAIFTKKDGSPRVMNCQYLKDQTVSALGYIKVKEAKEIRAGNQAVRQVNIQTLIGGKIAGQEFKIR